MNEVAKRIILEEAKKGNVYPCTIVSDRYSGTYSGAKWLAFYADAGNIPDKVGGDDGSEMSFWRSDECLGWIIGKGDTPDEAYRDLVKKVIDKYL